MYSKLPSAVNRAQSVAPICKLFSKAFRSQQGDRRMYGRKANSVDSYDSLESISSTGLQGRTSWDETGYTKSKSYKKTDNLDEELEVLARELLPKVLRMPFTADQWMAAINSVCGKYPTEGLADDYSEKDYQRKRVSCPERPKLPMTGLSSMERRLRDTEAKPRPKETPPPPQQTITLRVPDPMNLPIMWVPKLPPQTAQLLRSMPCEIFQDIHRNCQQTPDKPQGPKYPPPRRKLPPKKPLSKPGPQPRPAPRAGTRRKRRRGQCCRCCCRMTRQELECSGSAPAAAGRAYKAPVKPASAPPPAKPKVKSKPAPKPKPKPKPEAKPAPKAASKPEPEPEPEKAAEEAPPKVEVKVEDPKPAAMPSKTGSESSSEEESSGPDTPPAAPAAPAAPPAAGKDFMADLFASKPAGGGSYAPSGASSPKPPAGGADWMSTFGGSSPKPPASPGADWLTGGASPAAPSTPKPTTGGGVADWLS